MCRSFQRSMRAVIALTLPGISSLALADVETGGRLTIASDYMFRGVSQTMSGAAVHGEFGIEADNGWYGYAWVSNVDFTESGTADDGARLEIDLQVGYEQVLTERLTATFSVSTYLFPGTAPGSDYNYAELGFALAVDGYHSLAVGFSNDVFGSDTTGIFYAAGSGLSLSEQVAFGIELGHYDLEDGYDLSYNYATLSISGELDPIHWQLSYFTTSEAAEEIFYDSTVDDRIVVTLSFEF